MRLLSPKLFKSPEQPWVAVVITEAMFASVHEPIAQSPESQELAMSGTVLFDVTALDKKDPRLRHPASGAVSRFCSVDLHEDERESKKEPL